MAIGGAAPPANRRGVLGVRQPADADDADLPVPDFRSRPDQPQPRHAGDAVGSGARLIGVLSLLDILRRQVLGGSPPGWTTMLGGPVLASIVNNAQGRRRRQRSAAAQPASGAQLHLQPRHAAAVRCAAGAALFRRRVPHSSAISASSRWPPAAAARDRAAQPEGDGGAAGPGQRARVKADAQAEALARNSQVINAMGMLNESILHWGRKQAHALTVQSGALDRNFWISGASKFFRLIDPDRRCSAGAPISRCTASSPAA